MLTRCAVLGDPVEHSLSPVLHRAGYAAAGLTDVEYDALQVSSGGLPAFLSGLDGTWRGLSLTMPLKREVLALARAEGWSVSPTAEVAGGANTLVRDGDGWAADNTDLPGAAAAVRERWAGRVDRVVVLGGGATAASVALALAGAGAREVTFCVRSPERAQETLDAVAEHAPDVAVDAVPLDFALEADVLVSTVPAQAQDEVQQARAAAAPVVFEVVYDPWPTPIAATALAHGRVLVSGLDLLVHQAALQFEQFTGTPAPLAQMRAAGEQALAERGRR